MVKSELIALLAQTHHSFSEPEIAEAVNLLIDLMSETLGQGQRIEIRGFGSFSLHYRAPRKARNPKTGEQVFTAAKYRPHFKPGKELRDRVDQAKGE
jgi:integration host factor subunit beta